MGKINPESLNGIWTEGYVLDRHIIKSEFLGLDEQGHEQFDTVRTELGQLIYELKYLRNEAQVREVIQLISPFLNSWKISNKIDVILPVPPSNKIRKYQVRVKYLWE